MKSLSTHINVRSVTILFAFLTVLSIAYALVYMRDVSANEEIQTLNIFPSVVQSEDFLNVHTLVFQDLRDDALFGDFNTDNSAHLESVVIEEAVSTTTQVEVIASTTPETLPELVSTSSATTSEDVVESTTSPTVVDDSPSFIDTIVDFFSSETDTEQGATVIDSVPEEASSTETIATSSVQIEDVVPEEQSTSSATSTISALWGVFKNMFSSRAVAQEATTTASSTETEIGIEDAVVSEDSVDTTLATTTPTSTPEVLIATSTKPVISEPVITEQKPLEIVEETDLDPPVIVVTGNNPAYIEVGAEYNDLGALIPDVQDQFLGINTEVNGTLMDAVNIDTSTSSVHRIVYSATDTSGNIGYAERVVVVGDAVYEAPIPTERIQLVESFTSFCREGFTCAQKSMEFSDFGVSQLLGDSVVENAQLRLSLAGKAHPSLGALQEGVIIEYFYRGEWFVGGSISFETEISNALNGGYHLFALPQFTSWEEMSELKVRLTYETENEELGEIYVDALWVEIETNVEGEVLQDVVVGEHTVRYRNKLKRPRHSDLLATSKLDYGADEIPIFDIQYYSQRNEFVQALRSLLSRDPFEVVETELVHESLGNIYHKTNIAYDTDGLATIQLVDTPTKLRPGKYTFTYTVREGGKEYIDSFEFYWGVLAVNPLQSIYLPDENVTFHAAALTDTGNTICDANLILTIVEPTGTSSDTSLVESGYCEGNNITDKPDYTGSYQAKGVGEYELHLTRFDSDGNFVAQVKDSFEVRESVPFVVERSGPTRIYPLAPYTMNLTIRANQDFYGEIVETVPIGFALLDTQARITFEGAYTQLRWNVSLRAGEIIELSYTFDAPDVSPFIYVTGPLQFLDQTQPVSTQTNDAQPATSTPVAKADIPEKKEWSLLSVLKNMFTSRAVAEEPRPSLLTEREKADRFEDTRIPKFEDTIFEESREWKIASDAAGYLLIYWDNDAYTPSGWVCASCNPSDDYYQRFLRGSSTAATSTSFGNATHTHSASGNVDQTLAAGATNGGGSGAISGQTHGHTFTPEIGATSSLPQYRQLQVLRSTNPGDVTTLPAGAIVMFDTAVPSGWTRYGAQDDYFTRGEGTSGTTGGSNLHLHSATGTTGAATGENYGSGGNGQAGSSITHTHDLDTSTALQDQRPPYIEVIYGKLNATSSTPTGIIAMFDGDIPAGWSSLSGTGADFNGRFMVGSTTYGTTGGATSHTHDAIENAVSSGVSATTQVNAASSGVLDHTHTIDVTGFSTTDNLPPYADVVVASRIGISPVFSQSAYRWYANENAEPPTDIWPSGVSALDQDEAITKDDDPLILGDVIRLRVAVGLTNASSTVGADSFKLQYGEGDVCAGIMSWTDVGQIASTTAWRGYDNSLVDDADTLSSTTLSLSNIFGSYEEENNSTSTPNEIGVGDYAEYDWVIENYNAAPGTSYCFRMVESDETEFTSYPVYPKLVTNAAPNAPELSKLFDNEQMASSSPWFEFKTFDIEGEELHYQIQVANDVNFTSTITDSSSSYEDSFYTNLSNPLGDKAPFENNEIIRFTSTTTLADDTTYWWRVRASDPNGSNQNGQWSTPRSFTSSSTIQFSTWYQTTLDQFETNTLFGVDATTTDQMSLLIGSTTGTTTSSEIDFNWATIGNAWGEFSWNDTEPGGSSITYRIEYFTSTSSWALIPDTDLTGNSTGFGTSPVDLLNLNTETYERIRLTADFIDAGTSPSIQDWSVAWGSRVSVPTLLLPFDNEKFTTTTPEFTFFSTDPDDDDLQYQISWSTTTTFTASTTRDSLNDAGFENATTELDVNPFNTGDTIRFRVQPADTLNASTTYWWRTRAKDPLGSNSWSFWSSPQSFTTSSSTENIVVSTWFQDTTEQFDTDTITGFRSNNNQIEATPGGSTLYTFDGITNPSSSHVARDFEVDVDDPTDPPGALNDIDTLTTSGTTAGTPDLRTLINGYASDAEATNGQYVSLANSDDNRWTTTDPGTGDNAVFWASFNITEEPVNISQIDVLLEGYQNTGTDVAWLGVWVSGTTTPFWQELSHSSQTADFDYTGSITSNIDEYIDESGNIYIIFFNEDVNDPLIIDYVEVDVTSVPSAYGTTTSSAIDFDDGDGPGWGELSWNDSEPGASDALYRLEYFTSTSSWAEIPDSALSGNTAGFDTSPLDISSLSYLTYNNIRLVGSFMCDGANCPTLQDWTVTWQPGITISGTAQAYDQTTNLNAGTVSVAVNGELQRWKTGIISGGVWSIPFVTVFPEDVVTVFINGASDSGEAVGVTRYDGVGDITGIELYERHLSIGSDDNASTTNSHLSQYDFSVSQNEDIFFDVDGANDLYATSTGTFDDVELYIKAGNEFRPDSSSSGNVYTHDIEMNGHVIADGNTFYIQGSWDNNDGFTANASTVVFTATSTTESIDSTGAATSSFNHIIFGQTSGTAIWNNDSTLDINGDATIDFGTLSASTSDIFLAGDLTINASGIFAKGSATTTFDGSVAGVWIDNTVGLQDLGRVAVDGSSKTLNLGSDVALTDLTIGANDTLNVTNGNYDITVYNNWINNNIFNAQQGTVVFATTSLGATIDSGSSSFYNVTFEGASGGWSFIEPNLSITNDFTVASGTVTMPTGTTTVSGSFTITDTFEHNVGSVLFNSIEAETIQASTSAFYDLYFNGSGGTWTITDTNATTSNDIHILDGTPTLPSGTFAVGNDFVNSSTFTNNGGTVRFYSSFDERVVDPGASSFGSVLFDGTGSWAFPSTADITVENDFTALSGVATSTNAYLYVGGSWLVNGTSFAHASGTVVFNSTAGSETIDAGLSLFATTTFDSATGVWSIVSSATSTDGWNILSADNFTVDPGVSIEVQGQFLNSVGDASTTWTGSTLYLNSGTDYGINTKAAGADAYGELLIGVDTDIDMWNSTSTIYTVDSSGSLYSKDHNAADGDVYIWGDYIQTSSTDYWSYATDFDGTDLSGGSERIVDVFIAQNATATFVGGGIEIVGSTTASTTINNQGTGSYSVVFGGNSTVLAEYYAFRNMDANGLTITGTPSITSLDDGDFELATDGWTTMTIGASAIDANTQLQIQRVRFATTTAITGFNVTATGTPSSFWWFRNHYGNLDGESFDDDPTGPAGNPGYIRWDDSLNSVNISGFVFADESGVVSSACGGGPVVTVVVDGGNSFTGSCNAGDGSFTINSVGYLGDPVLTIYLDTNGVERAVTVTKTPTVDIEDLYLYENTVIVRHEDVSPLTIEDMAIFDSVDDPDIFFTAATSTTNTLVVLPENELHIWSGKTFVPGGNMTLESGGSGEEYDGTLHAGTSTTLTFTNNESHSIGGSFIMDTTTVFNAASTTLTFTATTTGKLIAATSTLQQVIFDGVGGGWNIASSTTITGDLILTNGTATGTADISVSGGDVIGSGVLNKSGGTLSITSNGAFGGSSNWTLYNVTFGDGVTLATTTKSGAGSTTITNVLRVNANHILDGGSSDWILSGAGTPFVLNGSFEPNNTLVSYTGSGATSITTTSYERLLLAASGGSPLYSIAAGTLTVNDAFTVGDGINAVSVTADGNDATVTVGGTTTIESNATLIASDIGTLTVGASWLNYGTFTNSSGLVVFNASTTGHVVQASTSPFFNVDIDSVSGGWTFLESATATNNFNLNNAASFTLDAGTTLQVDGQFSNGIASSTTTWTDSTLYLNSGTTYSINVKDYGDDTYGHLLIGGGTQIRMWNSTSTTVTTLDNSSLYSQDHNLSDGILYIWGDYQNTAINDYWSYATDFDGVDLTGSERQVAVYLADNASTTVSGGSLSILGNASASTTIQAQGGGTYGLEVSSGSFSAQYYQIRDIAQNGLTFSGSPTVSELSDGDFLLEISGGNMITVAGATIDANNGKTFTNNIFATSTGVTGGANASTTGTSVGSWRFTSYSGNYAGESFDLDLGGNPGYIIWDDSDTQITISGTVYTDEGTTPAGGATCNGSNQTVHLSVGGAAPITTSCDGSGNYSISGITFNPGDVIAVYLDADNGATFAAANVTVDPATNIVGMDLYQDRVIVRHEGLDPITNANLSVCDSSTCDSDIPFDVVAGNLSTVAGTELHIWTGKSYAPNGDITLHANGGGEPDGTLHVGVNSAFIASSTETHTIGGSFNMLSGALFTPATSTVVMTASTTGKIISATSSSFYNLTFNGSGGAWSFPPNIVAVEHDMTITAGTVTLGSATTTVGGSFNNTGGTFAHNNGLLYMTSTQAGETIEVGGSDLYNVTFNGAGGEWTYQDANATTSNDLLILSGSTTLPTNILTIGGSFENRGGTFTAPSGSTQRFISNTTEDVYANGSEFGSLLFNGIGGTFTIIDEYATSTGDVEILNGSLNLATGTMAVAESFNNSGGSFTATTSSIVLLYGSGPNETIAAGGSLFENLYIDGASGSWTLSGDATTSIDFKLLNATDFTANGFIEVQGEFTNLVGGAGTTWSGSTLYLRSGTTYEVNTKSSGGDSYDTLLVGSAATSTDISFWNSTSTIYTTYGTSSIYSQDHNSSDGDLYIWGDYERSSGSDYWSYATDFDGTDLSGGSERIVSVFINDGATTTYSGGTLNIIGASGGATTSIQNQGVGDYSVRVIDGTINASYYSFQNLDAEGLYLYGPSTVVTSLSNGDFELSANGGSMVSVASTTIDNNPTLIINNTRFATTTGITSGFNLSRDATSSNAWNFNNHLGNYDGEAFDNDGVDACGSFVWDDSTCLQVTQDHYRFRNNDGGIGVPDSEWYNTSWSKRQRIRITDTAGTSTTNVQVKLVVEYDSDMQADFDDLRFTDDSGTTSIDYWIEETINSASSTVWVDVPQLNASSFTDIFMYYGNALATDSGVGTSTFIVFDDFEDNDIDEYSGDTVSPDRFDTSTSFDYQGLYGLTSEAGSEGLATTDGLYRTGVLSTFGQNNTVRFFQNINLTTGADDETCTLFGVQSAGSNYAVCLDPYQTDQIIIAEDVTSDDDSGTTLATKNVTFTSGWYEVEVDWQYGGIIDVNVYKDGAFFASTTATDTTYTSGGFGFSFWGQHGGWDYYTARQYLSSDPTYSFGLEQGRSGATWKEVEDTPLAQQTLDEIFRIRFTINNTGPNIFDQNFRLEAAPKTGYAQCESVPSNRYTDVPINASCGSGNFACMATSSFVTNLASTTQLLSIPTSETFTYGQFVEDALTQTGDIDINQNYFTEVEYALRLTNNATSSAYCLRVDNSGTDLDSYSKIAEVGAVQAPILTNFTLNGASEIYLTPGGTTTVYATGTVIDLNGADTLDFATTTIFRSGVGASCTADDNNCYEVASTSCSFDACLGNSCELSCSADIFYFADPTDTDSVFDLENWVAEMTVYDEDGYSDTQSTLGVEMMTLRAITSSSTIAYGSLAVDNDTGSYNATTTITNDGNQNIDLTLEGTDLTFGPSSIDVTNQFYATTTFTYSACGVCGSLTASPSPLEVDLFKPTSSTTPIRDDIYWGLYVPPNTASAAHEGTNTFTAVED